MAPHVEDARDRLVAMNRPFPSRPQAAIAESDAEERSRQPLHFTDKTLGIIKHGPTVVEAVHVGEPSLDDPKRTLAPDVTKQNMAHVQRRPSTRASRLRPLGAVTPTGPNEPPRSDQPSTAPLQMEAPRGGTGVGVQVVNAPAGEAAAGGRSQRSRQAGWTRLNTALPAAEKPAEAPDQVNDIKPGSAPDARPPTPTARRRKRPRPT